MSAAGPGSSAPGRLIPGSPAFIALLGGLTGLGAASIDMNLPALPHLALVFRTSADTAQLSVSLFVLGFAASQLVYGPLSDRLGRRPVLLTGVAIFTAAGIGCALSRTIGQLVMFRLLQGIGACVGPVLGRAMVRDLFDQRRRTQILSYMTLVMALGPLLGPIAGGYLLYFFGWPAIFVALALAGALLLAASWWGMGETLPARDPSALRVSDLLDNYARFVSKPACVGHTLIACTVFAGMFAYISGSPFVLIDVFGIPSQHYGYLFALTAIALMAGATTNGRLLRHFGSESVLAAGAAIVLAGSVLIVACAAFALGGVAGIIAPMMIYVFGFALVMPNAVAAALEPVPEMAGLASSLIGAVQMAGGAVVSYAVGALFDGTAWPMVWSVASMGVVTVVLSALVLTRRSAVIRP